MLPFIHLGHLNVPTFGLMLWIAAVAAAILVDRGFRRARIDADAVAIVAIAVVAGIVGAKLWHVLDTPSEFHELGWRVLWDSAGFAWYGGLVFGIGALAVQGWRTKIGWLRMLDFAAPAAAVGYGIGRIGCLLSGDGDYGIAVRPVHFLGMTFHPWGMSFPHGLVPISVPVYPTPLYELAVGLLIGWYLWRRAGKPHAVGMITGQYLALSGLSRFLVEFIRRNSPIFLGLSNAQLASVGAVVAGVALAWWSARRPVRRPVLVKSKSAPTVSRPA